MQYKEVMAHLESKGSEQTRKIYRRHGATELFGVKTSELEKLKKKIKCDHELAKQLWNSGNNDAQTLALMIADPEQLTSKQVDAWIKEIEFFMLSGYLGGLLARSPIALKKATSLQKKKKEFFRAVGYSTISSMLRHGIAVPTDYCKELLKTIEKEIHGSANRARYSMNNTMIAIGTYKSSLTKDAIATAKRVGPVEVEHGTKGCKTPEAVSYIKKAAAHQKSLKVKKR